MVLDTWFTSGMTPDINAHIARKNGFMGNLLPMSLRVQAHDIIRTWLLYTTIHAHFAHDRKPFDTVMMSGHVLAGKGEKISKSKGNAKVEPDELLINWGADPVRYWALSGQLGKDMIFDEGMIKNGNKLVMKLWNVGNFLQMTNSIDAIGTAQPSDLYATDRRILARLQETIAIVRKQLDAYEIGLAKIALEEFFRQDFCDVYLEMIKLRLYKPEQFENGTAKQQSARWTCQSVFFSLLSLFAPYIPHVTEELYQIWYRPFVGELSLHRCSYPSVDANFVHEEIVSCFTCCQTLIGEVRKYKTTKQLSLGAEIGEICVRCDDKKKKILTDFRDDLCAVAKASGLRFEDGEWSVEIR